MPTPKRLLILGGTTEAASLARIAVDGLSGRLDIVSSLAGRTEPSPALAGAVRSGGFGGADGLADFLEAARIDLVVDATHPFAAVISAHARTACERRGVPRLMVVRPPWRPEPDDRWTEVTDGDAAAALLPSVARRAFLTVGTHSLSPFAGLADLWFLVRVMTPPEEPLPLTHCEVVIERPPFTVEHEQALMAGHQVDVLVTKQSGGTAGAAKLAAARRLGLPVVLVARPPQEPGEAVETADQAFDWLSDRV